MIYVLHLDSKSLCCLKMSTFTAVSCAQFSGFRQPDPSSLSPSTLPGGFICEGLPRAGRAQLYTVSLKWARNQASLAYTRVGTEGHIQYPKESMDSR